MGMLILSIILTIATAFFITSIIEQKSFIKIFLYMTLTIFAAIVLNIEILSLFNLISELGILTLNFLLAIFTGILWFKKGKPLFSIKFKRFFKKIFYAIMTDKYLLVLGLSFIFMVFVSLFLIAIMPVVSFDAQAYHALRSLFWISNGNLNHFVIADIRNIVMPINSEILYLWFFIFLKKQLFLGIFAFVGYLMSIFSIYGILNNLKFSERHKLWVIFILSSLPSVITQMSGTETDIIISGLVLSSIYLYWQSVKENKTTPLYMAALSYALAIGTKTPSLILMFPVGIWMIWFGHKYNKENYRKIILKFLGFGLINFIIFSSYNYVLNFLEFGNIFGPKSFLYAHNNQYGIRGALAGFIKHLFMFFDFAGFKLNETLGTSIIKIKNLLLTNLHVSNIPDGFYTTNSNSINRSLMDPLIGMGILGIILYFPCWLYSFVKPIFCKNEVSKHIFAFGLILLGAIIVMSYTIPFMTFNIRFITSFCIVCSPIIVYSYNRKNNILKFIFVAFALFGLLLISTHLWERNFSRIITHLQKGYSIEQLQKLSMCSLIEKQPPETYNINSNGICIIEDFIKATPKSNKILYIPNQAENLFVIKFLNFEGRKIDFCLLEDINNVDVNQYDDIILSNMSQIATYMKHPEYGPVYNPEEGITCLYMDEKQNSYLPNTKQVPHKIGCGVENTFFKNHNFVLNKNITIQIGKNSGYIYSFWKNNKK